MARVSSTFKKKLALLLVFMMVVVYNLPYVQQTFADNVVSGTYNNICWSLDKATGKLTIQGSGTLTDLSWALNVDNTNYYSYVQEAVIADGITELNYSFSNCQSLARVTLPNTLKTIGYNAFHNCSQLKEITIPDSVTTILDRAFLGCSDLENITLPAGVTKIGAQAFEGTKWLENMTTENPLVISNHILIDGKKVQGDVVIPDDVTIIANEAFSGNNNLTGLVIPETVTKLGDGMCRNCNSLTSLSIPESFGLEELSGKNLFVGCNSLYVDDMQYLILNNILLNAQTDTIRELAVPEGVTAIGASAFEASGNLTAVSMAAGVTTIDDNAFKDCWKLSDVALTSNVSVIGEDAFYNCYRIQELVIPEGVTTIGNGAFRNCREIQTVSLPTTLKTIGNDVFRGCTSLAEVSMPVKPENCGCSIFDGCELLCDENDVIVFHNTIFGTKRGYLGQGLHIAADITDIAVAVPVAGDIEIEEGNQSFVVDNGSLYTADYSTLWHAKMERDENHVQTFKVSDKCKKIAYKAISQNGSLIVTIPNSVEHIDDDQAFYGPDSITFIGEEGSYAQQWATDKNIKFKILGSQDEEPGNTEEPSGTQEPGSTEEPGGTQEPGGTEEPGGTQQPGNTQEPGGTEEPGNTDNPGNIEGMIGDANGDSQVNLEDAQLTLKCALKIGNLSEDARKRIDVNGDGQVNLEDAQLVLKAALKIITLPLA